MTASLHRRVEALEQSHSAIDTTHDGYAPEAWTRLAPWALGAHNEQTARRPNGGNLRRRNDHKEGAIRGRDVLEPGLFHGSWAVLVRSWAMLGGFGAS